MILVSLMVTLFTEIMLIMHTWFHAQLNQKLCDGIYYISPPSK